MPRETFTFDGKQYGVTAKTEPELAVKVAEKKKALEEGSIILNKSTAVKKWTEEWLETYVEPNVSDATLYANAESRYTLPRPLAACAWLMSGRCTLNGAAGCSRDHIKKM